MRTLLLRFSSQARTWPLLSTIIVLMIFTGSGSAVEVSVEAESCLDGSRYHNVGGNAIRWTIVNTASGGYAIDGVDVTGDWIEVSLYLPEGGCFQDTLYCQSYAGLACSLTATIFGAGPGGEDLSADHHFVGEGWG